MTGASDKPLSIADLKQGKRTRSGGVCPSCMKNPSAACVMVQVREGGKHVRARSHTLCEACTIEAYTELVQMLEAKANVSG